MFLIPVAKSAPFPKIIYCISNTLTHFCLGSKFSSKIFLLSFLQPISTCFLIRDNSNHDVNDDGDDDDDDDDNSNNINISQWVNEFSFHIQILHQSTIKIKKKIPRKAKAHVSPERQPCSMLL